MSKTVRVTVQYDLEIPDDKTLDEVEKHLKSHWATFPLNNTYVYIQLNKEQVQA